MTAIPVCFCGELQSPHRYRHIFEKKYEIILEGERYIIDCNQYKEIEYKTCSVENCNLDEKYHYKTNHKFSPITKKEKIIRFQIPRDTKCTKCAKTAEEHDKELMKTHHFTAAITFTNKKDTDIIKVTYPDDEEIKIIYE